MNGPPPTDRAQEAADWLDKMAVGHSLEPHRTHFAEMAEAVRAALGREAKLREALKGVSNAYGCFAGCTGALPGASVNRVGRSAHTPACREARAALAGTDTPPPPDTPTGAPANNAGAGKEQA